MAGERGQDRSQGQGNIAAHVWVDSKAEWHAITDDLPQFDAAKPRD